MREPSQLRVLLTVVVAMCFVPGLWALDPNRTMTQFVRQQWKTDSGFANGTVRAIVQTADGYLWIGTDRSLVRFDGFSFRVVSLPTFQSPLNAQVLGLATDVEGNLLVRMQGIGILRQIRGHFETIDAEQGPTTSHVTAMWRETDGGVLLSDLIGGLIRFQKGRVQLIARHSSLPGSSLVISIAESVGGKIWMGTLGNGLSYMKHGQITNVAIGWPYRKINCLLPDGSNEVLVGTDNGLFRWTGTTMHEVVLPEQLHHVQVLSMLRDRDSNLWLGTAKGLVRINAGGISFSNEKSLRGDGGINALFEDREGNIWVGGALGLERIRDSAFVTYSPATDNGPVYVDAENRTWFAPADGGLYLLHDGEVEAIEKASLHNDVIYSITGKNDDVWVGRQHGGLTHIRYKNGRVIWHTYTESSGLAQNSIFSVYLSRDGTVWAGTLNGGLSRFRNGQFTTYSKVNGLASDTINSIAETHDGTMWFGTANGLSSFANDQWKTYSTRQGLPSETVNCIVVDSAGVLWIGTTEGLAFWRSGRVSVFSDASDSLRQPVFGLAEDKSAGLWVATSKEVLQFRPQKLLDGTLGEGDIREYGLADGLKSTEGLNRSRSVVTDPVGRIWFSMSRGLSFVDPSHLAAGSPPAIVHVEGVTSDGSPVPITSSFHISGPHKRITFLYTSVSLAIPERIRFRYRLDAFDSDWSESTAAREAAYTNLNPGAYTFRVIASNSDGVWNGSETDLRIMVDPAFWQTWWFRLSAVSTFGFTTLGFFRIRVLNLATQMNVRMEERVNERTRIARELHDSLLQGFQGLMFRLQGVQDLLPGRPYDAMRALESALNRGDDVIAEGRGTVEDLRSSTSVNGDLAQAFSLLGEELAPDNSTQFRVLVEGKPRSLDPIFRDEAYRIAREALRNAFCHAQAQTIEAEIMFGESKFVLRIRDDGNGIDPKYLDHGKRAGHWGLPGMRERAKCLGGQLEVWSENKAGTEIELTVPAAVAYGTTPVHNRFSLLLKQKGGQNDGRRL